MVELFLGTACWGRRMSCAVCWGAAVHRGAPVGEEIPNDGDSMKHCYGGWVQKARWGRWEEQQGRWDPHQLFLKKTLVVWDSPGLGEGPSPVGGRGLD